MYHVLEYESLIQLQNRVKNMIDLGWKPQGGIAIFYKPITQTTLYYQAMIKKG